MNAEHIKQMNCYNLHLQKLSLRKSFIKKTLNNIDFLFSNDPIILILWDTKNLKFTIFKYLCLDYLFYLFIPHFNSQIIFII